jgi:hypothetical protein
MPYYRGFYGMISSLKLMFAEDTPEPQSFQQPCPLVPLLHEVPQLEWLQA